MDNKIKHLEFIQSIISRMANNSFLIKGWTILWFTWLTALLEKDIFTEYVCVVVILIFIFWFLDSYFLCLERKFRELYNIVRSKEESNIDFDMTITKVTFWDILKFFSSFSKFLFYWTLFILTFLLYFLIK